MVAEKTQGIAGYRDLGKKQNNIIYDKLLCKYVDIGK